MPQTHWQFWIDRGGTFTDIIGVSPRGHLHTAKYLSSDPQRYRDAALFGITEMLSTQGSHSSNTQISTIKMGTTLATNALLERRGEKTVLAITKGFGDALTIAYQNRPEIFALNIVLPQPLFTKVIEIEQRHKADGQIAIPLNIDQTTQALQQSYNEGFRALAIVLMHSYLVPEHELTIAHIAKDIGFQQISLSHQVSPLIRFISRGDTTVIDAYLSRLITDYVNHIKCTHQHSSIYFMQSQGGLIDASLCTGKDAIFSGPAGGIIGAIKTAQQAGFNNIISFDMGGTSTDVGHFAGELDRVDESLISGFHLRAPMLRIHTIAAGGGSIIHLKHQRFQVGPDSAGAYPGPACYRQGGPLTITDCNLALGRIHADFFPRVFGEHRDQKLDKTTVDNKLTALAHEIQHTTNQSQTSISIAEGFLNVAVNNMANAIKKVSIARGHNVSQYTLCCFGGAGGQHACRVADCLGMTTIFIPKHAGILSAYGMGLADVRFLKEHAIEKPLTTQLLYDLTKTINLLLHQGRQAVLAQHISTQNMTQQTRLRLHYAGSNTTLELPWGDYSELVKDFHPLHQKQFGYIDANRPLQLSSIAVETVGQQALPTPECDTPQPTPCLRPAIKKMMVVQQKWQKVPLYCHQDLTTDKTVSGPALITQDNSTIVVEPNWQASCDINHNLILTRTSHPNHTKQLSTSLDPVMLEIFNNLLMSIAEQMGEVLAHTAMSINIKERLDFSCAIFDKDGDLIVNAPHIPVHLGSMSVSVKALIQHHQQSLKDNCAYLLNDPYAGGTHLPDITVITPLYLKSASAPQLFVASRGHHADIGGMTPGSIPATSYHIDQEGILMNYFMLVDQGKFCEEELLSMLTHSRWPARNPQQNMADLKAQVAANQCGITALTQLIRQYGIEFTTAYMQHIKDNAAWCVKETIQHLNSGEFAYQLDNGSTIKVAISINKSEKSAHIDFSGSSPQQQNNFNAPLAVCHAAILYVFRALVAENIPLNQGCFQPLKITCPQHSLLNPSYPAAVVAGNVETSQAIVDTLLGALGIMAASQGTMNNITFGNSDFQYYETLCGGAGAGEGFNGANAVHTHMTNSRLTDPEILEQQFPVIVSYFKVRKDSGGKGRWCGGNGVLRKITFLSDMQVSIVSNRRQTSPFGLAGGQPAKPGINQLIRQSGEIINYSSLAEFSVSTGDAIVIATPGGGGYGATEKETNHSG